MQDAIEAKLISWNPKANGEVRISFMVQRDDAPKVDALRWLVGHDFGLGFAKIDQPQTEGVREEKSRNGAVESANTPSPPQLSQTLFLRLCKAPKGRTFLEEFCAGPGTEQGINSAEYAKQILKERLGVQSLSEVDTNPVASEKAEQILNLFAGWERGL